MKNITLLLLLGILCLSSACNKDDDSPDNPWGLPDATQTGENTFGCLIDGVPWVAEVDVFAPGLHEVIASYDEANFGVADNYSFSVSTNYITSSADSARKDIFSIRIKPIYGEGVVDFSQLSRKEATYYTELLNINGTNKIYELDTLYHNQIDITKLDTTTNICSANFNLQLIRDTDTLLISEGRFDVKYQPD